MDSSGRGRMKYIRYSVTYGVFKFLIEGVKTTLSRRQQGFEPPWGRHFEMDSPRAGLSPRGVSPADPSASGSSTLSREKSILTIYL